MTTTQAVTPQPDSSRKWWVMLAVGLGVFLATIDSSIVNISLPTLTEALHTNFATIQWVVLSYMLTVTCLILGVGRWADMIGRKALYLSGVIIFTVGSGLSGWSPTVGWLIGFRAVQGVGAAMLTALGTAIITAAFPARERGRALGIIGSVVSVGITLGPTIGGVLIGTVGWRSIFLVNLPVGVVAAFMVIREVPRDRPPGGQRFDYAGGTVLLIGLLSFSLAMTFGRQWGWSSSPTLGLLAIFAAFSFAFVIIEWRAKQPMVDLSLFRSVLLSINLITGFMMFVLIAGLFIMPFYLQLVKGYPTPQIGLMMAVVPVAMGIISPLSGSLSDRFGTRPMTVLGLAFIIIATLLISTLNEQTTIVGYLLRLLPLGLGVGFFQSPNNSAIMGAAPKERLGVVSGLLALSRSLGGTTGLPIMGAIFATQVAALVGGELPGEVTTAPGAALVGGIQTTFRIAAALLVVAFLLAVAGLLIERRQRHTALYPRVSTAPANPE